MTTRHGARCESAEKSSRRMARGQRARCGTSAPRKPSTQRANFRAPPRQRPEKPRPASKGISRGERAKLWKEEEIRGARGRPRALLARPKNPAAVFGEWFLRFDGGCLRQLRPSIPLTLISRATSPFQNTRKISYPSASSTEESLFSGLKYRGTAQRRQKSPHIASRS
jgi:hypothetical protein